MKRPEIYDAFCIFIDQGVHPATRLRVKSNRVDKGAATESARLTKSYHLTAAIAREVSTGRLLRTTKESSAGIPGTSWAGVRSLHRLTSTEAMVSHSANGSRRKDRSTSKAEWVSPPRGCDHDWITGPRIRGRRNPKDPHKAIATHRVPAAGKSSPPIFEHSVTNGTAT